MKFSFLLFLMLPALSAAQSFTRGDTLFNQTDTKGRQQGFWEKRYPNELLQYKGFFKDGHPSGEFLRYYEEGPLKALMHFSDDGQVSRAKLYYQDGQLAGEGKYVGNLKDSTWNYYSFFGGQLAFVENYHAGKKEGLSTKFYPDGNVSEKLEWKNDLKHGNWEQYYPDGTLLLKSAYHNGKLNGEYLIYHPDGQTSINGRYVYDQREGEWNYFEETGELRLSLIYRKGIALNQDELDQKELEFLNKLEKNKGRFSEPTVEDLIK